MKWIAKLSICLILYVHLFSSITFASEKDAVVLQLRWDHQFQFAGYYVAQWLGYYDEEGLTVDIRSAFSDSGVLSATEEVASGHAQFGIGAADILIAQDSGQSFSLVASIFQRSAVDYYSLEQNAPHSVYALSQMNIARRDQDLLDIELQALFLSEGITPYTERFTHIDGDFTLDDLTSGRYQVIPSYLGKLEYESSQKNIPLSAFHPINYGIDFYGDTLFTSKKLASSNPDLVERFRRASLKGWLYALEHPQEVADKIAYMAYIHSHSNASLEDLQNFNRYQATQVKPLTHTPIVEIGNMNPHRWAKMASTLKALNIIKNDLNIDDMIFNYDTINIRRLQYTGKVVAIILLTLLSLTILVFLTALKRRNTKLKKEILVRKQTERQLTLSTIRYETIFQSAVIGITMTDSDGKILHVNDAWCQMTGYPLETLLSMAIVDLIYPESHGIDTVEMQKLHRGEIKSYTVIKKYYKNPTVYPDQTHFYGKLFMTRIFDPKTEAQVNMAMVIDVTREVHEQEAEKRSEERFLKIVNELTSEVASDHYSPAKTTTPFPLRLEAINLELEKLFKHELEENHRKESLLQYQSRTSVMGEMIDNIAHQWRQPLNTLRLILSNLKDEAKAPDPDYTESALKKAQNLIDKMSETIDDFRYFINPAVDPRSFDACKPLYTALDLLEEQMHSAQITVSKTCESTIIYGPDNQLTHALFNILSNAIEILKLNASDHRHIAVKVYKKKRHAVIYIGDTGPGVPKEHWETVFEQHFTTHKASGGSGLGLYMSRTIIENSFSGSIKLIENGPGAHFEVCIPLYEKESPHDVSANTSAVYSKS